MATKKTQLATVPAAQDDGGFMTERPEYLKDQPGNRGSEGVQSADLIIPRLELVQSTSPVRDETDPAWIEGATDGDLYNTVSRQLYGKQAFVVPVYYRKEWNVWAKRKKGEGPKEDIGDFQGSFATEEEAEAKRVTLPEADCYDVIETPTNFCLLVTGPGKSEEIIVSMPRTKFKVAKKWNSLIRMAEGDRFSRVYKLEPAREENAHGKFFNFAVSMVGFPSEDLFHKAEKLYAMISAGDLKFRADVDEPINKGGDTEY